MINIGPIDLANSVSLALPANGTAQTTGIIDMQAVCPASDAWRLGRFAIVIPAIPEANVVANTITIAMQVAAPSLTNSPAAPANPVPGAFAAPPAGGTITIPGIVNGGIPAQILYLPLAFDLSGSVFQFYQFVVTVGSIDTLGEVVTIGFANA